ncbi:MerC domain-containing protein [Blastopirellula marina]|uniref:Uncharacterized protein n=1 Tax=Blastopirellula marina TaxID=124 RepID=A0A2S8FP07_9BACT|nr:MerC domain-containing protein [Blastopirellula marina]PQO33905.1 hypothetical protein C5Y98_16930 [Blastopirellula marina]PTL43692.1 MerC domain-containing protein [Blastopirellula marina]
MNVACRERRSALPRHSFCGWARVLCVLLLGLSLASLAKAQGTTPLRIEERELPIYLLPVKDGVITEGAQLERVIDFPADAFRTWFKQVYLPRSPQDLPKYSFERVTAEINVVGDNALITTTYEIVPRVSGWIRIPLGLRSAVFRSEVVTTPTIECFVDPPRNDSSQEGYSLWCEVPAQAEVPLAPLKREPIKIQVTALIALSSRGDEISLDTNLPADTKCLVKVDIPRPGAIFSHHGSMVVKSLPEPPPPEHSIQHLEFAGGPLGLHWRFDEQSMVERSVQLQVNGVIQATVDVETVITEANLEVSSKTIAFDSFEVQIDDNAQFVAPTTPPADYTVRPLDSPGQRFGNRLLVELAEPTKEPVKVSITTKQTEPVPSERGKRQFSIGQFDVVGSQFQDGVLNVVAANNVHVMWDTPSSMREQSIRNGEIPNLRAAYLYDHQPATLIVNTQPIQSTARVKSEYELRVGALDSELVGRLTYRLPRTYHDDLVIDMKGWSIDLVDTQGAAQWQPSEDNSDQIILPLASETGAETMSVAPYRTIKLTIRARLDHAMRNPSTIELPWPIPRAEPWGTATVKVIPTDDIEIRYQSEMSEGFQLDRSQSQESELSGQRGTIVLRAAPSQEALKLGLSLIPVVPRLIIASKATVELQEGNPQSLVKHELLYEPFHCVREKAIVNLPEGINVSEVMSVLINGTNVAGQLVDLSSGRTMEYPLGDVAPPYRIELKYTSPIETMNADRGQYQISLLTPKTDDLLAERIEVDFKPLELTFQTPHEVDVLSPTEDWQSFGTALQPNTVQIPGNQFNQVEFSAPFLSPKTDDRVVVDFHWLQVALTSDERRDRATYALRTAASKLNVTLPKNADYIEVYWNGVETAFTQEKNHITFDIAEQNDAGGNRLEIWYKYPAGTGIQSSMTIDSPQIENAIIGSGQPGQEAGYSYLQIISPGNWLVLSASNMSEEMEWTWQQGRYRRKPRLNQDQLERLAKIHEQSKFPAGMDRSLYSTIGPIQHVHVTAAKTSYLMLLFSGIALAGLLFLFYVPQSRHVLVFGIAAIGIVGLALAFPDFAVVIGQMSVVGIMLGLLGIILYHMFSYRAPVKSAVRARSSSDSQASVPVQPPSNSAGHSAVSTTSLPATVPSSGQSR